MCCAVLGGTASALHLCIIAMDRYLAIIHPLIHKRVEILKWYSISMVATVWLLSLMVTAPIYIFDLAEFWQEGSQMHCDIPKVRPLKSKTNLGSTTLKMTDLRLFYS